MNCYCHARIVSDLKELVQLLRKYKFGSHLELHNLERIISAANQKTTEYNLEDLILHIVPSGMNPMPKVKKISVIFQTKYTLADKLTAQKDIFTTYTLQIFIQGYSEQSTFPNNKGPLLFCWHLDREPNTNGDYIHPYYHLHAGGKFMDEASKDGNIFLISSPRIPHPPMDIILLIHFMIINFIHGKEYSEQRTILDDCRYKELIRSAQKRVLDPYYNTISKSINNHEAYTQYNLVPFYV